MAMKDLMLEKRWLPGRRSTREQYCSTQSSVER